MDIVKFKGGLGNQMFQYAFMEALRHKGREVAADLQYYDLNDTDTDRPFILNQIFNNISLGEWKENDRSMLQKFIEKQYCIFQPEVFSASDRIYLGYWQSEKYFKDISEQIQKKYLFHVNDLRLSAFGDDLQKSTFSIHVRRGDYLINDFCSQLYGGICTMNYYQNAMNYIEEHIEKPRFLVFTDDVKWVTEQFNSYPNVMIFNRNGFDSYEDWYDMYLMTRCRGNIIANSSFSWWGAWLNSNYNKIVIAPKTWLNNYSTDDVWCDEWIQI